jgi:ankyrin repeat protein
MELVQMLVNQGADIDAPGVLHSAIAHIPVLEYLISKGADINKKGSWGTTALHMAAYKCREEAVKVLVANGADIALADDEEGQTPMEWAREGGCKQEDILEMLGEL